MCRVFWSKRSVDHVQAVRLLCVVGVPDVRVWAAWKLSGSQQREGYTHRRWAHFHSIHVSSDAHPQVQGLGSVEGGRRGEPASLLSSQGMCTWQGGLGSSGPCGRAERREGSLGGGRPRTGRRDQPEEGGEVSLEQRRCWERGCEMTPVGEFALFSVAQAQSWWVRQE